MRNSKGFTLIEMVMVIVIISILIVIAIPKFIGLQNESKQSACDGNLATIRTALNGYYAKTAATGTAAFPASLTLATFKSNYFTDATTPACPYGTAFVYDSTSGVVTRHVH